MPPKKKVPGGARKRRGGFPCPECEFIAKHAMGLGRHRSTRHGVVSQRQKRRRASVGGAWLTREQAAARAGVHYNTIRQWEQGGLLRKTKKPGVRGALVSAGDLGKIIADRSATGGMVAATGTVDAAAVAALEARFAQLIAGLEQLLETVKGGAPARSVRAPKRAAPKGAARRTAKKKAAKKKSATSKTARRSPAKRKPARGKPATRKSATKRAKRTTSSRKRR